MRPLAAASLAFALAAPAAADPYVAPPADPAACERALSMLETRGGAGPIYDSLPEDWLGIRVQKTGARRGIFLVKVGKGAAHFHPLNGASEKEERISFETRRDNGTALFVEVVLLDGKFSAAISGDRPPAQGWTPSIRADFTPEGYNAFLGARLTGGERLYAPAMAAAHKQDQADRNNPAVERMLSCPRAVYGSAIVLCRMPGNEAVVAAETEYYCRNVSVCFRTAPRVPYEDPARCASGAKGDRLDRREPLR